METIIKEEVWVKKREKTGEKDDSQEATLPPSRLQIMWLQKGNQKVSDTEIRPLAIFGNDKQKEDSPNSFHTVRTSRRMNHQPDERVPAMDQFRRKQHDLIFIKVNISLIGYLFQLIGLRQMHSSATLAQLVETLFMTVLRAWVRRGLSKNPNLRSNITEGYE